MNMATCDSQLGDLKAEGITSTDYGHTRNETISKNIVHWSQRWRFTNKNRRANFIVTVCVYYNFVILGWTYGQLGTAFPDIQLILNASIKQASLQWTLGSIGYMTGSLVIGAIFDRVNKLLLLSMASLIVAATSTALPYCTRFWLFMSLRFVSGVCTGGLDSGGNAKVASSWGTEGRQYMQALHFSYALGGIISPLITSPFLAPRIAANSTDNSVNYSSWENTTTVAMETADDDNSDKDDVILYEESRIQYAFLVTGILTFISAFLYFVLFLKGYDKTPPFSKINADQTGKTNLQEEDRTHRRVRMNPCRVAVFLAVYGLTVLTYSTVECKLQSLLMPFVMKRFHWTKQNGALLMSLLWGLYGFGRLCGVTISRYIGPTKIIIIFLCCTILSSVGIVVGAFFKLDVSLWIFIPLSGMSISVLYPTFIVWTSEHVIQISGKMAAFFVVMSSVGFMVDPLYMGKLIDDYSSMYFAYVQLGQAVLCLTLFCSVVTGIRYLRRIDAAT